MHHVCETGDVVGIDWMQIGDAGDELAEVEVRRCENLRILSLQEQEFHRVVALFRGHVKCVQCSKWLVVPLSNVDTVQPSSMCRCVRCGCDQSVNIRSPPPPPSIFNLHIPSFVEEDEICIVPVKLSGDGFQVFSSVGCELDGFDWVPLNLPIAMTQTVRNSFSLAAFPSSISQSDKSTLTRVFANCERFLGMEHCKQKVCVGHYVHCFCLRRYARCSEARWAA